ncbi:MAG: hypothetical protein IKV39_05525 [Clostridia bacterium]|nr:hypothetical protein [Clostridia bacterium]
MKKLVTLILVLAMMIGFAVVANAIETYGTVVYGYKVDKAPNMEMIDESWGEPVAYVDKNSPNAELAKYWTHYNDTAEGEHAGTGPNGRTSVEPEDSDFWLYICYDSKYIYFGFKSPDEFPYGCVELHRGDGIHMWLQPLETMEDPAHGACGRGPNATEEERKILQSTYYFYWNLAYNDYDTDKGNAADFVNEAYVWFYDDMMHATIAIPRSYYGLHNKNLDGVTFGISVLRCSSWCELDEGFAGWLNWGEFMSSYTTKPDGVNTVVFVDAKQGEYVPPVETEAPETEAPAVETEAPETEAPETEAPETEAPETEAPETEAPETEAPETEAPVVETEAPETEAPAVETEAPETEVPVVETEAPETEAPVVETDAPETTAPETDAPVVETEAPETDAPVAPETNAPETSAPTTPAEPAAEKNNTGLIIGIVAAVVVVGAVVGIVLGKKKK